jgi:hypothetical protein
LLQHKAGGNSRGEGSVLGGLGNLLMEIIVINFIINNTITTSLFTRLEQDLTTQLLPFILLKSTLTKQQRPPEMGVLF